MKTKMPRNYVRTQRRRWAFTQEEVADLLGFESRTCISRIEQGKRVPTLESALALEVLFGEPPKSLFPHVYAEAEEALMQRAAVLYEGLINTTSPREKRKCELLEDRVPGRGVRGNQEVMDSGMVGLPVRLSRRTG